MSESPPQKVSGAAGQGMSRGLFSKLSTGLNYLDGAFKESFEGDVDQPLDDIIDQRKKRKQRVELAREGAPFGSALAQSLSHTEQGLSNTPIQTPPASSDGARFSRSSSSASLNKSESGPVCVAPGLVLGASPVRPPPPKSSTTNSADPDGDGLVLDASNVAMGLTSTNAAPVNGRSPASSTPILVPPPPAVTVQLPPPGVNVQSEAFGPSSPPSQGESRVRQGLMKRWDGGKSTLESGGDGEAAVRQKLKDLQRELKELNEENNEFEQRILGQEKELKAAAEALAHTNTKAAARELDLLDEIRELKAAKETDRLQYTASMSAKDKAMAELQSDLAAAKAEMEVYRSQLLTLRQEIANIIEDKEKLQLELEASRSTQERGVEGLQAELRSALDAMDDMKLQHSAWMRQAQRREAELEGINADLTDSLASKQREVDSLRATISVHDVSGSSTMDDLEMHRLHQELQATQGSLEIERQHVVSLQREIRTLQHELSAAQAAWKEDREAAEIRVQKALGRNAELEIIVADAQRAARENKAQPSHRDREEHDARIKTLSAQLMKKQEQLDAALCDKYALDARLKSSEYRLRTLETQLADARNSPDSMFDVEAGTAGEGVRSRLAGRKRSLRPISRMGPIARNLQVARAVDVLDRLIFAVGHYLRVYPLARLAFVVYLFLVNVWAFIVIVFSSHRIETVHSDTGGSFLQGPGSVG